MTSAFTIENLHFKYLSSKEDTIKGITFDAQIDYQVCGHRHAL